MIDRDSYGINVKGLYGRPILPQKVADVGRFEVRVEKDGVLQGGVLCADLIAKPGPFTIDGSVLALGSVMLDCSEGQGTINGPVSAGNSLLAESRFEGKTALRIVGDVSGKRVTLRGAVVYGNVYGMNVQLTDCVVMGVVYSSGHMKLENSLCFTFVGKQAELKGEVRLLSCSAVASDSLEIHGRTGALAFLPWQQKESERQNLLVPLTADDVKNINYERADGRQEKVNLLSCYDRLVDVSKMTDTMAGNIAWVEENLVTMQRGEGIENAAAMEQALWALLNDDGTAV